jgi:hypothetical protein
MKSCRTHIYIKLRRAEWWNTCRSETTAKIQRINSRYFWKWGTGTQAYLLRTHWIYLSLSFFVRELHPVCAYFDTIFWHTPVAQSWHVNHTYTLRSSIFWDITSCSLLKVNRRIDRTYHLHLQVRRISQARNQHEAGSKLPCYLLRASFLLSVDFQRNERCYIIEDRTFRNHRCEDLKSYVLTPCWYVYFHYMYRFRLAIAWGIVNTWFTRVTVVIK